jgi:hypothetical protein
MKRSRSASPGKKKAWAPELSIDAAKPLQHQLVPEPDQFDSLSMMFVTFTMLGVMKMNPLINWVFWFVLLSFYINRADGSTRFSQSLMSLIMVTGSIGLLYWRMMKM